MSEYHAPEILRYDPRRFIRLLNTATKRRNARDLFFRWVAEGFSTRIPFDEYRAQLKPAETKSASEILLQTKNILEGTKWQPRSLNL